MAQITTRIVFVGSSNNLSNARTREGVQHAGLDFHNNLNLIPGQHPRGFGFPFENVGSN